MRGVNISDLEFTDTNLSIRPSAPEAPPARTRSTRFGNNSILSPRINDSEVANHFKGFSYANDSPDEDDLSVELGRNNERLANLSLTRKPSLLSRPVDAFSSDDAKIAGPEKTTSKGFSIPTEYRDDDSFMMDMGIKENIPPTKKASVKLPTPAKPRAAAKARPTSILPDISGLSSIFSTDEAGASGPRKKKPTAPRHKTVVSVPLDDDDRALFSAFSSFQTKIDKLQEDKSHLKEVAQKQQKQLEELTSDYNKALDKCDAIDKRGKKFKTLAMSYRDKIEVLEVDVRDLRARLSGSGPLSAETGTVSELMQQRDAALEIIKQRDAHISHLEMEIVSLKKGSSPEVAPDAQKIPVAQTTPVAARSVSSVTAEQPAKADAELTDILQRLRDLLLGNQELPAAELPTPEPEVPEVQVADDTEIQLLESVALNINKLIELKKGATPATPNKVSAQATNNAPKVTPVATSAVPKATPVVTSAPKVSVASAEPSGGRRFRLIDRCRLKHTEDKEERRPQAKPSYAEEQWEEEATERPSMPAEEAVEMVIERMTEELDTLKQNYEEAYRQYSSNEPGSGKRRRQQLAEQMASALAQLEAKSDLIYAMNDIIAGTQLDVPVRGKQPAPEPTARMGTHEWIV